MLETITYLNMGTWPKDSIFSLGRMDSRTCFQNCNSTGNSNQSVNNKRQETEKVCNRGEKEVSNINTGGMVDWGILSGELFPIRLLVDAPPQPYWKVTSKKRGIWLATYIYLIFVSSITRVACREKSWMHLPAPHLSSSLAPENQDEEEFYHEWYLCADKICYNV